MGPEVVVQIAKGRAPMASTEWRTCSVGEGWERSRGGTSGRPGSIRRRSNRLG